MLSSHVLAITSQFTNLNGADSRIWVREFTNFRLKDNFPRLNSKVSKVIYFYSDINSILDTPLCIWSKLLHYSGFISLLKFREGLHYFVKVLLFFSESLVRGWEGTRSEIPVFSPLSGTIQGSHPHGRAKRASTLLPVEPEVNWLPHRPAEEGAQHAGTCSAEPVAKQRDQPGSRAHSGICSL